MARRPPRAAAAPPAFDRAYYRRYYHDPKTAVTSKAEMAARGRMIAAIVAYAGLPVRHILDAGCGLGLLRPSLGRGFPGAAYHGLETSAYLCARYGWAQGSVIDWRSRRRFDLVVCYDVLQYLGDRDAARALANLARLCRGALYFGALTQDDWQDGAADRQRSDRKVRMRPAAWYRTRLGRHFDEIGAGVWLRRGASASLWTLEAAAR